MEEEVNVFVVMTSDTGWDEDVDSVWLHKSDAVKRLRSVKDQMPVISVYNAITGEYVETHGSDENWMESA
jgi:hypothetical protein